MTGSKDYKKYFEDFARQWVLDAYNDAGYNFPLPYHRARIVSQFISALGKRKLKILDLGCGGGDVTFLLAKLGHEVVGVDRSKNMIALAETRRRTLPKAVQTNTRFLLGSVDKVPTEEKFDAVVAMGLIGYLKTDAILFRVANGLLKPGGHFLVSCRNRLFNMTSLTFRTKKEIKQGSAIRLIEEIEELHSRVPEKEANEFIKRMKQAAKELPARASFEKIEMLSPSERLAPKKAVQIEPRQQTPKELVHTGKKTGFKHIAYFGIRPHLLDPNLNQMLPPRVFNILSRSLEALEHLPVSLVWSSVFIGVFKKTK